MKKIEKAFTLVELMVVIAIIAVLAGVSIVGYTSFIDREKERSAITEATQAREIIAAEVIKTKNGEISFDIDDPTGKVILSYDNGELYVRTEPGIIHNNSKSTKGFDAMLRKTFPSLAPLPGFFNIDGSIISYNSDYENEAENIIVNVVTGDVLKHKDKDTSGGSSSGEGTGTGTGGEGTGGEGTGTGTTPTSSSVMAVFGQSSLRMSPGTPFTVSYEVSPAGINYVLQQSGNNIEIVDNGGSITVTAISEGTSYVFLSVNNGKNKAEAKLTVIVDKDSKTPVALPTQKNILEYNGKDRSGDVEWDIPQYYNKETGKYEDMVKLVEITPGTEPGSYQATFSLLSNKYCWAINGSTDNQTAQWTIVKKELATPYQIGKLYTIGNIDSGDGIISSIISYITNASDALASDKTPSWDNGDWKTLYNQKQITIDGQKGRSPGKYRATFTITGDAANHYVWESNNSTSIDVDWSILRTPIPIPTIDADKEGNVYVLGYREGGVKPEIVYEKNTDSFIKVSGDTEGKNVGKEYTITLTLSAKTLLGVDYTDCIEWEDGTTTPKTLKWKITKMYFDDPKLADGPFKYTGSNITPKWVDDDQYSYKTEGIIFGIGSKEITVVEKSGATGKDVGEYTTRFTLKDTTNYGWKSTTGSTVSATWSIGKADGRLSVSKSEITLKDLGKNSDISLSNYTDISKLQVKSSNTNYVTASINTSSKKLELNVVKQDDLQHTATITITDSGDKNYNEVNKQVIVTVNKARSASPLELSKYAITLDKGTDSSISIKNSSGATLTVESEDSNYVTAKINKGKVEITVKKQDSKQKQVKLTVNDPGNDTYSKGSKEIVVTINPSNKKHLTLDTSDSEITIKKNKSITINITDCSKAKNVSVSSSNSTNVSVSKSTNSTKITVKANKSNKTETITIKDKGNDDYDETTITITIKTIN